MAETQTETTIDAATTSGAAGTVVTLEDGREAAVRRGKVKDLVTAARLARSDEEIQFAVVAVLTTVGGQPMIYEDLLELPLGDWNKLQAAAQGGGVGKRSAAPPTSSTSAAPQA